MDIERNILKDIEPLGDEGAIARYQINKQKQSVTDRQNELPAERLMAKSIKKNKRKKYKPASPKFPAWNRKKSVIPC
ncbi:MAG UNVERIFIED_CONTAM: hypothetical protein LVR29_25415 [Microcystis novacekii LVE1205-3]